MPWLGLGLPAQQPAQLVRHLPCQDLLCGQIWVMLSSGQGGAKKQDSTALWCSVPFQRDSESGFLIPVASWVCFWEGIMSENSLNAVLTVPFSGLSSFTVELLTPWKIKEVMFLTSVNRWEVVCSGRCRTSLAAPLRWALSLELCLFVMSVRKSFEKEPYRHPLIRFLQGDLFSSPLMA